MSETKDAAPGEKGRVWKSGILYFIMISYIMIGIFVGMSIIEALSKDSEFSMGGAFTGNWQLPMAIAVAFAIMQLVSWIIVYLIGRGKIPVSEWTMDVLIYYLLLCLVAAFVFPLTALLFEAEIISLVGTSTDAMGNFFAILGIIFGINIGITYLTLRFVLVEVPDNDNVKQDAIIPEDAETLEFEELKQPINKEKVLESMEAPVVKKILACPACGGIEHEQVGISRLRQCKCGHCFMPYHAEVIH